MFSAFQRPQILEKLTQTPYDLIIIGGGITGAGIALDAVSRGFKTALIEKEDFASGTSSRSTKLIHGGLRYLKQLDVALVREVGQERSTVHKLAPHLVVSEKMLMPIIKNGTYGKRASSLGLKVYDVLAGVEKEDRRRMLSKKETLEKEPLLEESTLLGSGYYAEYRTDDARLTLEVLKTAVAHGADAINYLKAQDFFEVDGKVKGIHCEDQLTGKKLLIKGQQVVSAAGPWVDQLRKINESLKGKRLHLTKGVHLVVKHEKFPVRQSVYFDVPDGRMIFAIPRGKVTYFGTTDTDYKGKNEEVHTDLADAQYLIKAVNSTFPSINLKLQDIQSSWAGLRPLIHQDGKSASELSRKDEIFEAPNGLISIAGGKLTGYRKMAERIMDLVMYYHQKQHKGRFILCKTNEIPLKASNFENAQDVKGFIEDLSQRLSKWQIDRLDIEHLVHVYGVQANDIVNKMEELTPDSESPFIALIRAELWWGIHHELVMNPMDFYIRRTGRLYFDIESVKLSLNTILADFQGYFNWSDTQFTEEKERIEKAIYEAHNFVYLKHPV